MSMFEAFFLALIQGLTEFLPVSSSAHLLLPSQLLGWNDQGLAFDVAVHVGTLMAVLGYFRHEVIRLFFAFFGSIFKGDRSADAILSWRLFLATLPAGIFGFFIKDFIELYLRSAWVFSFTCIFFGLLLWWTDKYAKCHLNEYQTSKRSALLMGGAQAIAMIPGTSRSGATMSMALYLGYTRDAAARFSFLMSIPIILLAGTYLGTELVMSGTSVMWEPLVIGLLVSFVSAYLCIHWFLKIVTKIGMLPFVIYRILLGIFIAGMMFVK